MLFKKEEVAPLPTFIVVLQRLLTMGLSNDC